MEEKAKDIWSQVKGAVGGLSRTVKAIIVAVIVVGLTALAIFLANSSKTEYEALFTGLSSDDMAAVTKYLQDEGVTDIRFQGEDTILVPAGQEAQLKAKLIAAGYPQSSPDYGLYLTNVSSLSTESDRSQMALYELMDRMAATIRCYNGVSDAVVNIVPGEDRRYVLSQDDTMQASASVVVTMKDGEKMNQALAESIKATVSHSVKGLVIDEVDIRDSEGNSYDGSEDTSGDVKTIAETKLALEDQWNKKLRQQVMDVMEPIYGEGNVSCAVNVTVNMDTSQSESTIYSQPDWAGANTDGEGIVGKHVWSGRVVGGEDGVGGVVGTDPNADLNTYVEQFTPDGTEQELEASGEKVFDNNKTITQQQTIGGYIEDVTVSVSINSRVPNTANQDQLVAHVGRAVGISQADQANKISIISHEFYRPEEEQGNVPADTTPIISMFGDIPLWVYLALLAGLFLFMVLFVVFVLLGRSRSRRRMQPLEPVLVAGPDEGLELPVEAPVEEPSQDGADIMDVHTEKSMELRKSVRELADSNPEIAAQAIKTLLRGDDGANGG